ncbi:hypothetical protein INT46_000737 [Mucor plumbeus]|uniref:Uncharacterized protein n=1 Tax=Mucor plumbeus TaxID=97098 RepID=A0A8H7QJB0_9FUNG|nr:hypothetical protein INT46_000737 [Mucor plumbeus]
MDLGKEVDIYNLDILMTLSQYWAYQSHFPVETTEELDVKIEELGGEVASGRKYNVYSDKQKAVFFYFNRIKLWKASPSTRKTQIEVRTAQKWAKRLKDDPARNIIHKLRKVEQKLRMNLF